MAIVFPFSSANWNAQRRGAYKALQGSIDFSGAHILQLVKDGNLVGSLGKQNTKDQFGQLSKFINLSDFENEQRSTHAPHIDFDDADFIKDHQFFTVKSNPRSIS